MRIIPAKFGKNIQPVVKEMSFEAIEVDTRRTSNDHNT